MASLNPIRAGDATALIELPESPQPDRAFAIDEFLASEETKDLLRFSTAGWEAFVADVKTGRYPV